MMNVGVTTYTGVAAVAAPVTVTVAANREVESDGNNELKTTRKESRTGGRGGNQHHPQR